MVGDSKSVIQGQPLARAVWLLEDYIELLEHTCAGEAQDLIQEARAVVEVFKAAQRSKIVLSQ